MQRFYVVKKKKRFQSSDYSFEFESKKGQSSFLDSKNPKLPALYDLTDQDREQVLLFIKKLSPDIELGYESFWKKIKK